MRKPNGFGSIKKLSGNRRRPYVYVITRPDGKRQALAYFENQAEAEIFQIDYVKEHFHRSLPGHKVTFAELFYRWLPTHIADIEPAQSTIDNYHNSFRHCVALQEMPVAELKFMHFQQVIDSITLITSITTSENINGAGIAVRYYTTNGTIAEAGESCSWVAVGR